jgi:ketosteroid isomerase-like protein
VTRSDKSADTAAIRALIDKRAEALRAKDADGVVSGQAPEIVSFTLAPPLQQMGDRARAKERLKAWFATWCGPLGYEVRDLSITVGGEVAFCLQSVDCLTELLPKLWANAEGLSEAFGGNGRPAQRRHQPRLGFSGGASAEMAGTIDTGTGSGSGARSD